MSNFARKTKQRIIDDYLQATGYNIFKADEFVDWLANQPEHEMYSAFYGTDDATAARQWRIDMARRMASGLRIVVKQEEVQQSSVVSIKVAEYPAYISPVSNAERAAVTNRLTLTMRRRKKNCVGKLAWLWPRG